VIGGPTLEAISISNFRSVRGTIALPLDASIVLLHGSNGAGKTSVMSALELALTGEIAELRGTDRKHLVHRGAESAAVELSTSTGAHVFRLEEDSIEGSPLLDPELARFFTERCYLTQRTLGQLLEIYQAADGQGDSALTRFVKELLRLDELDALFDGLESVRDRRLVKRLVPEYAEAETEANRKRAQIGRAESDLKITLADVERLRAHLTLALQELGAPSAVVDGLEVDDSADLWLETTGDEKALASLVATRQEIAGLRSRWSALAETSVSKDSVTAENHERVTREAANVWWGVDGAALEAVLDEFRDDLPGLPSVVASQDPAGVHETALEQVTTELNRQSAFLAADEASRTEIVQLDDAIMNAQARISVLDEQLASSETVSVAEDLSRVLASLIPHVHGDECPVCMRNYGEISNQPLSALLATRVSALGERTDRLQALARARLEAVGDLQVSQEKRRAITPPLEPASRVTIEARAARLRDAQRRLVGLTEAIGVGARLIHEVIEAEKARAVAQQKDRASVDIRRNLASLASDISFPQFGETTPIGDAIGLLEAHVASRIAEIAAREDLRQRTRKSIQELAKTMRSHRELELSLREAQAALSNTQGAISEVDRRRQRMRSLRSEIEANRIRIVRQVFNDSLNRTWRDLFVRLAQDEPFVPAFRVPASPGERVAANLETVHRDGKPGGSPGAMLSAGNLNTAALTLFLALHLSAGERLPWLMLDDPVQSMDELHISQFAALLRTLAKEQGRRLVVAVHERQLFEYLTLELSPAQPGDSLVAVELSRSRSGKSVAQPEYFSYEEDSALATG
jgi:exonuclease SbcC